VVSADDNEPQINPQAPEGAAEEGTATPPVETPSVPASPDDAAPVTPASTAAPEAADAAGNPTAETPSDDAPADPPAPENSSAATTEDDGPAATPAASGGEAPAETAAEAPAAEGEQPAAEAPAAEGEGEQPAAASSEAPGAQAEAPAAEGEDGGTKAEGDQPKAEGGEGAPKRKRRPRGRRQGRGGQQRGGRRRFQWDEVFLRQRLEILRAMDPDPKAIEWAIKAGGRFDVADILAGEGSSGREFGRRAYAATPETDDQAAWIILSAVRARDIVPIARQAVSETTDQREQVKAAIEKVGIARVNPALQGERPPQQVFAERAKRVDMDSEGAEEQKAAWALLSLARPQDVKYAASPPRPRTGGPGRPGGNRFGDDDRRGRRREPGIPGGKFSVGESGIGGELGAKLRAALAAAENNEVADTRDQKD
jgi:hypothetical protein